MYPVAIRWLMPPWLVMLVVATAGGSEPEPACTNPADAGPDYLAEGEYVGALNSPGGGTRFGVQVIAQGDGTFNLVAYSGGLPGAGWDQSGKITAQGRTIDGIPTFTTPQGQTLATILDGLLVVNSPGGNTTAMFYKTVRKSPTLGKKPPPGALVLFDGTSADNFQDGRMTDEGLLMEGVTSKQDFQDFSIHLEFRTPFKPAARGQQRGNSGFYAQGRYEVQILDSFGLDGEWNECGGIYKVSKPKVNMCLPPLSWQTYDVDFTAARFEGNKKVQNARMTVRHNGVLIQQDVEIPHTTNAARVKAETPQPGPIYLQDHGNPVRFRNIWVVRR